jgi:hypothetical protein
MKKFVILSLMGLIALSADAQRRRTRANTSQGNWAVSLEGGYKSETTDPAGDLLKKYASINLNPSIGYFVVDNLEIGASVNVGNEKTDDRATINPLSKTVTNDNSTGFGLYLRKYWPVNNWFAFTGRANAGMNFGNTDVTGTLGTVITNSGSATQGFNGGINLGLAFTPVNNIALQSTIGGVNFNSGYINPTGVSNDVNFSNLNVGLTDRVNFGITWFFGRGLWSRD